ncbi:hypothetical protein PEL8287_00871 [Roseovarius litorisediminis]|uniref:Lipoprotein n=1 Tax=Roseovarius litorisediminis TaxID=1312363 RepID=A0A1Y5RMB6_9RHOB|nr:hypothetical protein [Roseovarius litorisediminis]SLN20783.1 hypothetical protein PEL8287_00871 [Roseovarius litorisediminis]
MRSVMIAVSAAMMLGGCAAESVWAPDEAVAKAAYHHDGPTRLTLYTMLNNRSGAGAHTSLMVNGSQRIIFDPAGSFKHPSIPERNDVVFGVTPQVEDVYTRYHARETYHVKVQKLDVSPEVAARAMQLVQSYGPVPSAQCSRSTSTILAQLFPGQVKPTWYPKQLAEEFGKLPGVREQELYEDDSDDNSKVLREWTPGLS